MQVTATLVPIADTKAHRPGIRGRLQSGQPNPIDVHVGSRLRHRRMLLGLSQGQLGEALGLTFQQIRKYESGTNRISASRLWKLSTVLVCSVAYFFDHIDKPTADMSPRNLQTSGATTTIGASAISRETIELVRAYYRIPAEHVRRQLYLLMLMVSRAGSADQLDVWAS